MEIRYCVTDDDIAKTFDVMLQLRPLLKRDTYVELIKSIQKSHKYWLVAGFDDQAICVAVAGFKINRRLLDNAENEFYVDDLVTDLAKRSQGLGNELMSWLKTESKRLGCRKLVLDSGLQRIDAHRFYRREGLNEIALHFVRPTSPSVEAAPEPGLR